MSVVTHTVTQLFQYIQLLVENYESAKSYISYIRRVEERYNDTMNAHPDCEYCVKFKDIKQKAEQLILNLESLVSIAVYTKARLRD